MAYTRKTKDIYGIFVNYGYGDGWEHEIDEDTLKEAKERKKEYRENVPEYPVRIIKRRVPAGGEPMTKELVKTWKEGGFTLRIFDLDRFDSYGKFIIGYEFRDGRELIFQGEDIGIPASVAIDSPEVIPQVLFWFTLQPGDTDADYFDGYTPRQTAWRDSSRRDDLDFLVNQLKKTLGIY